ncbi:permease prefix domain 1-containing protein [Konateibacter massiliensis]|uniref:permease prefix domain 1-containing protein n=1 Tax=Konateibacter massiliensis TaxID=2002841 RepID=UPI000C145B70|nr:permease prefix domain 1-containing protein [Konateibacter massiliensis]
METIQSYLNSIFNGLPHTDEILRLKLDLQDSMEEKFHELKREGKTENEAIGIVISEFGNVDEILNEMGISTELSEEQLPDVNLEEAKEYIALKRGSNKIIGVGVSLIILGVAFISAFDQAVEDNLIFTQMSARARENISPLFLFIFLVPAIGMFIYSGTKLERFKFVEENRFRLTLSARGVIENICNEAKQGRMIGLIVGVSLLILSVLPSVIGDIISESASNYSGSILLTMVSIGVFILITSGSTVTACNQLLQVEEFDPRKKKEGRLIGVVASIVWPIAVCIFLVSGFVFQKWGINWVIFPITGILFGGFCAAYSAANQEKQ